MIDCSHTLVREAEENAFLTDGCSLYVFTCSAKKSDSNFSTINFPSNLGRKNNVRDANWRVGMLAQPSRAFPG